VPQLKQASSLTRNQSSVHFTLSLLQVRNMAIVAFWDVAPCILVMQAASTPETSVDFYETTWRNVPEGNYLHSGRRDDGCETDLKYEGGGGVLLK
jgi:hypothetical protein